MKKLNKDIKKSITHSWGRFLSIMLLMALGSFAVVGLSIAGPDMRKTGENYFQKYKTADITIISDYGIDKSEIEKIETAKSIKDVEYIYLKDVVEKDTNTSFRMFSKPEKISMYELVEGSLPEKDDEIAIDTNNKEKYNIGDTIIFTETEDTAGNTILKRTQFKIVGVINSTEILSTLNRGETTIGTGSLDGYAVINKNNFDSNIYMMAKILFTDTEGLDPYTDEYNNKIIEHKKELQNLLEEQKGIRFAAIKSEYQDKIDEASQELNNAKKELNNAKTSLDDAKVKIENAKSEILENQNKLEEASTQISEAENTLKFNKEKLNSKKQELASSKIILQNIEKSISESESKLKSAKQQLDSSEKLLTEKEAELNSKKEELENAKTELTANKKQLEDKLQQLNDGKQQYENGIKELKQNIEEVNLVLQNPSLSEQEKAMYEQQLLILEQTLAQTETTYNKYMEETYTPSTKQIEEGFATIEEKEKEIEANKIALDLAEKEINSSKQQLESKKQEYQKSSKEFEKGKEQYNEGVIEYNKALEQIREAEAKLIVAESEFNNKKSEYNTGVKTLEEAKKELVDKESEYYEKLQEYEEKEPDVQKEISDGEKELLDAQKELDELENPVYQVDNRREVPGGEGYEMYQTVSNIIDSLADIFPLFMYFVAALVTLTTMTRFVDEERINMGTYKALGYKDKDIVKKFVVYGFLASFIGTVIGVTLGHILIPYIVYNAYSSGFSVPKIEIHFYPKETLVACVLSFICSVIPAYITAKNNLKEKPSELLLPKAPAKGSKIFLERIKFVWNKMNFTHKVTARNIFRYKKRMLMTIFGVAGASALIFTGFSVQQSISTINNKQFENIIKYDMIVALNSNLSQEEQKEFDNLVNDSKIKSKSSIYYESISKEAGSKNDKQEINLIVPEDTESFNDYIHLQNRKSEQSILLDDEGVVISERLAKITNANIGDTITFKDSKDNIKEVKVSAVCEMYAGHFMFMSKNAYEKIYNDDYKTNAYMLTLQDSSTENTENVSAEFMRLSAVRGVVQNTTLYNQINTIVNSLNKIMIVLIVLSAMLTVVILFNLTNINVDERIRELSTIKVLGFRDNEVTMYIYRETILLSQIGIIVGWLLGIWLHNYILTVVPPDQVMFDPSLWIGAYIIPVIVVNIVTFALKFYINKKLINVDMIEALKSVD